MLVLVLGAVARVAREVLGGACALGGRVHNIYIIKLKLEIHLIILMFTRFG